MTISVSKQVNRINGELVVSQPKTPNSIRKLAIPQRAVELLVEEHSKAPTQSLPVRITQDRHHVRPGFLPPHP